MKQVILVLLMSSIMSCGNEDNYTSYTSKIFRHDPHVYKVAKAVQSENPEKIRKLVAKYNIDLNYQEPKFGMTLLMYSIYVPRYQSAKTLLELGADPNIQNNYDGTSAMMYAANNFDTSDFVRLVLSYGGDPNAEAKEVIIQEQTMMNEKGKRRVNGKATPLMAAASTNLESVKLLIEAGATNIDYNATSGSALSNALSGNRDGIKIARYLLIEMGADPHVCTYKTSPYEVGGGKVKEGKTITILTWLRSLRYPLGSEDHKVKMEVVDFLKTKGFDYEKEPIPKHFYKLHDKEYLEKY